MSLPTRAPTYRRPAPPRRSSRAAAASSPARRAPQQDFASAARRPRPTAHIAASARPLTREPIRSPRVAIPILSPSPSVSVLNAMLNNSNPPLLTIGSYFGVRHDDTYEIDFEPDRPRGARLGRHGLCGAGDRSEEHTSELQSLMRISYAVFCLKKKTDKIPHYHHTPLT